MIAMRLILVLTLIGIVLLSECIGTEKPEEITTTTIEETATTSTTSTIASTRAIKTTMIHETTTTFREEDYDEGHIQRLSKTVRTSDGGYLGVRTVKGPGKLGHNFDIVLTKRDSSGNTVWEKTLGKDNDAADGANSIAEAHDGGYIIFGSTWPSGGEDSVLLIKVDSEGNKLWKKIIDGVELYKRAYVIEGRSFAKTSDGGYIITGRRGSHKYENTPALLIKTDYEGNVLWKKEIFSISDMGVGTIVYLCVGNSIVQTSDGGYIIAGEKKLYDKSVDESLSTGVLLVKTDSNGEVSWIRNFGFGDYDIVDHVAQTAEGGYIIKGETCIHAEELIEECHQEPGIGEQCSSGAPISCKSLKIKTDSAGNVVWDSEGHYSVAATKPDIEISIHTNKEVYYPTDRIDFKISIHSPGGMNNLILKIVGGGAGLSRMYKTRRIDLDPGLKTISFSQIHGYGSARRVGRYHTYKIDAYIIYNNEIIASAAKRLEIINKE